MLPSPATSQASISGPPLRTLARVQQGAKFMLLDPDDDRLTIGFRAYEADGRLRWTDGCAALPAAAFARFDRGRR